MLFSIALSIFIAAAFLTPMMNTPISLGLWILFMSLSTTMLTSTILSSWFALILFIIYIGGMLVMFSYFVAIAPNQKMNFNIILLLFTLTACTAYIVMKDPNLLIYASPTPSYKNTNMTMFLMTPSQGLILIFLALILLLALILVVKVAKQNQGPLRPFI